MRRTIRMFEISMILIIFAYSACKHSESTFKPLLDIHGVLRNDQGGQQQIKLSRTYSMDEKEYFDLEDTQVILSGGGLCDTMKYYGFGNYFFTGLFILEPQTTYQIIAYADGYDTLFGKVTTPGDFSIIYPANGDTVNITDTLIFFASQGAREYQIAVIDVFDQYYYWIVWPSAEPESLFKLPLTMFSDDIYEGVYSLMVCACDSNFFNYEYYYGDDPPQCGVEGGIGLFGSMWVKEVDVYLKVN